MTLISASGAVRVIRCAASAILPQVHSSNPHSERGTSLHEFVRAVLTGTPVERALATIEPEHRATAEHIQWSKIGRDLSEVRSEVSYAVDVRARSARTLGLNIQRAYHKFNVTEDEIAGSDDVEGTRLDDVPVIGDLKFGYQRVAPCSENAQMMTYVLARALITGAPEVEGRIWYVAPDGSVWTDSHTFDTFELDGFADELEDAFDEVRAAKRVYLAGGQLSVSTGDWCRNCDSLSACPAYNRLARSMLGDMTELEARIDGLTLEEGGAAWRKAEQVDTILKRVWAALEAKARQEPLPLGEGKCVREITYPQSRFDREAALLMLKARGVTDAELSTLYRPGVVHSVRETNIPGMAKARRPKPRAMKAKEAI